MDNNLFGTYSRTSYKRPSPVTSSKGWYSVTMESQLDEEPSEYLKEMIAKANLENSQKTAIFNTAEEFIKWLNETEATE